MPALPIPQFCTECGKPLDPEWAGAVRHGSGQYFAGKFCPACWETFKRNHARPCFICHKPGYACCC